MASLRVPPTISNTTPVRCSPAIRSDSCPPSHHTATTTHQRPSSPTPAEGEAVGLSSKAPHDAGLQDCMMDCAPPGAQRTVTNAARRCSSGRSAVKWRKNLDTTYATGDTKQTQQANRHRQSVSETTILQYHLTLSPAGASEGTQRYLATRRPHLEESLQVAGLRSILRKQFLPGQQSCQKVRQ